MCTFTGFNFGVFAPGDEGKPENRVIRYDDILEKRATPVLKRVLENGQNPVSGELLLNLCRIQNLRRSTATDLYVLTDKSMVANLLDLEGNLHRLSVNFRPDSRDKLELTVLN
ncbi:hypothetical protein IMF27_04275 [Pseudomonas sp. PCH199]|uniref:hypothetical protein n=1 Tax=unclassified Pseudomonas TaxID=196821 RepID=UPI000FFB696F|nr:MULTISPECIES: hypothetical protein [unclassified Pseudomonas]MCW8275013.1 hypothetical protein [Pseudomonas sp. PCH199]